MSRALRIPRGKYAIHFYIQPSIRIVSLRLKIVMNVAKYCCVYKEGWLAKVTGRSRELQRRYGFRQELEAYVTAAQIKL
jgi:hypothetical protein